MKDKREKTIIRTSIINIISNFALAGFKAFVGILANSIAIVSDAVNNLSDALSSIITIIGTKLAGKAPDKEHPYGHGRLEYMTALIVSVIVVYAGGTALIESIKKIIHPETANYSVITLITVIAGIIIKIFLGLHAKKKGKEVNSDSLIACGLDAFNDAILSTSVLISALIYLAFNISLEAYVGVLVSVVIIKSGLELVREAVNNMIGVRIESDLSEKIKKEVMKEKEVQGAFDLVLNNYGPDTYLGSIHIELPDTYTVADVDRISRSITKNVKEKYGVLLHTIGVYSVNTKSEKIIEIKKDIENMVFAHREVIQMHGFFVNEAERNINFDIIMDFGTKDREEIYKKIYEEIQEKYIDYKINIILDVDASD